MNWKTFSFNLDKLPGVQRIKFRLFQPVIGYRKMFFIGNMNIICVSSNIRYVCYNNIIK